MQVTQGLGRGHTYPTITFRAPLPYHRAQAPPHLTYDSRTVGVYFRIPTIAQSETSALAAYEDQAKLLSMQGKHLRRSGRYNTGETVNTLPENRWPNKGFHASTGKKRVGYDDLTLPQWITGQLSNIYHMRDQTTARHALLQVILAMKDATSLPWTAVRSAWAMSMHDLEEGNLQWSDATQWSLNRISSSQISMAGTQVTPGSQNKKICKFYNEGTCSHDTSHGHYRHVCSFCERQGKSLPHPEQKCNNKSRTRDKHQNSN